MSLSAQHERNAPSESWWATRDRDEFRRKYAENLQRMKLLKVNPGGSFDDVALRGRMTQPRRGRAEE